MKKTFYLFTMSIVCINCLADDSSIMADFNNLHKINHEWRIKQSWEKMSMSEEEFGVYLEKIKERVLPILNREFAKLAEGEVTPLVRELLNSPEAMNSFSISCRSVLLSQIRNSSVKTQTIAINAAFHATPDSLRGRMILSFMLTLPKEVFSGNEIQEWLVTKINSGLPAGKLYFILTDENAEAVTETAKVDMQRFSKENGFLLASVIFLASRKNEEALTLLDAWLDERDINSKSDRDCVIPAAAMSGNEKLIQKIRDIITTDKRLIRFKPFSVPEQFSFAENAARTCSLIIEGFPDIKWSYDDETKMKVHDWLKDNPTHTIKPNFVRNFFNQSSFLNSIPDMLQAGWGEFL